MKRVLKTTVVTSHYKGESYVSVIAEFDALLYIVENYIMK